MQSRPTDLNSGTVQDAAPNLDQHANAALHSQPVAECCLDAKLDAAVGSAGTSRATSLGSSGDTMTASAIDVNPTRQSSVVIHEEDGAKKVPSFMRTLRDTFVHRAPTSKEELSRRSWMSALQTTSVGLGPTSTVTVPTARSVASTTKVRMFTTNRRHRKAIEAWQEHLRGKRIWNLVVLDVEYWYQVWFLITVIAAFFSGWLSMYGMAFVAKSDYENGVLLVLNTILLVIFGLDMIISLFVSKEMGGTRITDPWEIKRIYFRGQFWLDILGTLPFDAIALAATGVPAHTEEGGYIGLLGLLSLLRLYRMFRFFHYLETSVVINNVATTLLRNLVYIFFTLHWAACLFYYIARQQYFAPETWVGSTAAYFEGKSSLDKYWAALYWSATTVTTIGYGDVHPYTTPEFVFVVFFMVVNLALGAYFIGSITLLVTSHDRKAQKFRESVASLQRYTAHGDVDEAVLDDVHPYLDVQRRGDFGSNKIIHNLPISLRRRLLRSVYKPILEGSNLLKGPPPTCDIPVPFFDALLHAAVVEVFLPMVHIIEKGEIVNELYFIINGSVISKGSEPAVQMQGFNWRRHSMKTAHSAETQSTLFAGMAVGEEFFFNRTPSRLAYTAGIEGCRMLTITREKYKTLARDFPRDTQCMKDKVRGLQIHEDHGTVPEGIAPHPTGGKGTAREHLDTHKFIHAAASGQLHTVMQMMDKGQDINATDYAGHTALMMAAMNRRKEVVIYLLENGATVNSVSHLGTTALEAATQQMNVDIVGMLLHHKAKLAATEQDIACKLCTLVRQKNAALVGCYLNAHANVNAADYDGRTALHVAATQGDAEMVKLLLRSGARADIKDRWGRTASNEAALLGSTEIVQILANHLQK